MSKHLKVSLNLVLTFGLILTSFPTAQAADNLDFEDFKDALSLDANTSIDFGSYNLSISGAGALSFSHTGGSKFASGMQVGNDSISLQKVLTQPDYKQTVQ